MLRSSILLAISGAALLLAGCKKGPSPEMLAKLKGGWTTVTVYGFCVPMAHILKNTFTRHKINFVINGKTYGTMTTCGYGTFRVPSGYWPDAKFVYATGGHNFGFGNFILDSTFRPGKKQYLYYDPSGNYSWTGMWVSKERAEKGIAEIKKIGEMW